MIRRLPLLLTLVALLPAAAWAQNRTGRFEVYGGIYVPDDVANKPTYGLRGGAKLTDLLGIEGSLGRIGFHEGSYKFDVTLADISLKAYLASGDRADFFLFAGPGWAYVQAKSSGNTLGRVDTFTAHAGAGVDLHISDRLYVRPDLRGRWFQKNHSNKLDWEGTLALGFNF